MKSTGIEKSSEQQHKVVTICFLLDMGTIVVDDLYEQHRTEVDDITIVGVTERLVWELDDV